MTVSHCPARAGGKLWTALLVCPHGSFDKRSPIFLSWEIGLFYGTSEQMFLININRSVNDAIVGTSAWPLGRRKESSWVGLLSYSRARIVLGGLPALWVKVS